METAVPQLTTSLKLPTFGEVEPARLLAVDDLYAVVCDKFPISPGHTLIIARRPVARFQELTSAEKARLLVWIDWTQQHLASHLTPTPDAFNLGLNDGPPPARPCPSSISTSSRATPATSPTPAAASVTSSPPKPLTGPNQRACSLPRRQ